MEKKDSIVANDKWEFDEAVTEVFDNMLARSIPDYQNMRELAFGVGSRYVKAGTVIMDIGCSNGNAVEPFINRFGALNQYKLLDVSEPMLKKTRERYADWQKIGKMEVLYHDLRNGLPVCGASLILSILTLQFTPIEYRHKIVKSVYDTLIDGGAFIIVEKVLGNTGNIDDTLVEEYYDMKRNNQYTEEQIKAKRKSLEGVLVPITAKWNEELLQSAGFSQIDCFWRCLNFAGWIAIK